MKASKVVTNYTGRLAQTIHRRVGIYSEEVDGKNEIMEDVIIVDEASMCDVFIVHKLFKAIRNSNARILFIGDSAQLSSVGVGRFLHDLIESDIVKVSRLKKVFRQDKGGMLDVITDIREGNVFLNESEEGRKVFGSDCVIWMTPSQFIRDGILANYKNVIKRFNPNDVMVLSPTNKGALGTVELNKEIQKIVNPESPNKKQRAVGKKDNPTIFRVGDSVMNIVNSYDVDTIDGGSADIFNGDSGVIIDIDEASKDFVIDFEGIVVKLPFGNVLNTLIHGWCISIHKSQGSASKVVMVVADKSMKFQLNSNLLYTGLSRARNYLLVLSQASTINYAMKKIANDERRSLLRDFLADDSLVY